MKQKLSLITRIGIIVLIPAAFAVVMIAYSNRQPEQPKIEIVEPTEPLPSGDGAHNLPTLMSKFAAAHELPEEDVERLERIAAPFDVLGGQMSQKERLASVAGSLRLLATNIQTDSLRNHGFMGLSESEEVEYLRAMASLMEK